MSFSMQTPALSETLQARLDSFQHKFGKGAEMDENRIWRVTNLHKPEHERVPTTINGSVISRFIFDGHYDIQERGFVQPQDNSQRLEARRRAAIEAAKELETPLDPSPQPKKLKEKE